MVGRKIARTYAGGEVALGTVENSVAVNAVGPALNEEHPVVMYDIFQRDPISSWTEGVGSPIPFCISRKQWSRDQALHPPQVAIIVKGQPPGSKVGGVPVHPFQGAIGIGGVVQCDGILDVGWVCHSFEVDNALAPRAGVEGGRACSQHSEGGVDDIIDPVERGRLFKCPFLVGVIARPFVEVSLGPNFIQGAGQEHHAAEARSAIAARV